MNHIKHDVLSQNHDRYPSHYELVDSINSFKFNDLEEQAQLAQAMGELFHIGGEDLELCIEEVNKLIGIS